ncbi:MAG TPA: hypothetical protein VF604_13860 [Pyrinomonadaceae bacterium]|jgi:hypothetical protein
MKNNQDACGQQLPAQYDNQTATAEIIERDDKSGSANYFVVIAKKSWR